MATAKQVTARAWEIFRPTLVDILLLAAVGAVLWRMGVPVWGVVLTTVVACTSIPALFGWLELKNEEAAREEAEHRPESTGEVD